MADRIGSEPQEIAASRAPDRVVFTDWERVPKQDDPEPPTTEEWVAVAGSLLRVTRWEKRTTVYRLEWRKRLEYWDVPAVNVPMVLAPPVASFDGAVTDSKIVVRHIPKATLGRSVVEERRRGVVA